MEIRTTATVVAYNRKSLLQNHMRTLPCHTRKPDHSLIIENTTTDDSGEMLLRLCRHQRGGKELLALVHTSGGTCGLANQDLHHQHGGWTSLYQVAPSYQIVHFPVII